MSKTKHKFKKHKNGLVINTIPPKDFKHKGNIDRRNKEDELFYSTRMKILRRDLQPILQSIIIKTHQNTKSDTINILDVGCGDGLVLNAIKDLNNNLTLKVELHGIDLDEKAMGKIKGKVALKKSSVTNIPYDNSYFDLVTSKDVIEHLTEKKIEKKLSEIYRVLKPSGIFYCETPNPESCIASLMDENWWMFLVPDHLTLIPPQSMKRLLNGAKFSEVKTYTRTETDEQFDEVKEILKRIPNNILNKQLKFARYRITKYYLKLMDRGSITCSVSIR